jgi:hypothetical protein
MVMTTKARPSDVLDLSWIDRPKAVRQLQLIVAGCYARFDKAVKVFDGQEDLEEFKYLNDTWDFEDMDACGRRWCITIYEEGPMPTLLSRIRAWLIHLRTRDHKYKTANRSPERFWLLVKKELHLLICTNHKKYASLRRSLSPWTGQKSQLAYVSAIASGLAPHVGVLTSTILTPLSAICILATIHVGREVLCARLPAGQHIGVLLSGEKN